MYRPFGIRHVSASMRHYPNIVQSVFLRQIMNSKSHYSAHQSAYFAHQLTLRAASDSMDSMAGALLDAQVDLYPHQIDAAVYLGRAKYDNETEV